MEARQVERYFRRLVLKARPEAREATVCQYQPTLVAAGANPNHLREEREACRLALEAPQEVREPPVQPPQPTVDVPNFRVESRAPPRNRIVVAVVILGLVALAFIFSVLPPAAVYIKQHLEEGL